MRFFVDTNILIYARDPNTPQKQEKAILWLAALAKRDLAVINLQVQNELCHVALRKLRGIGLEELRNWIDELRAWGDSVVDEDTVEVAWAIRARYGFSWFDCLLLGAAELLGCTHFLSEDMDHGMQVGSVRLVDPFRIHPDEVLGGG